MMHSTRLGVFFACDTGSAAFLELRAGLGHLTKEVGLELVIFDQEARSDSGVLEKVEDLIERSLCVVADVGADPLRPINVNVMLEVGFARGISRPILLIANDPDALPSNLNGRDAVRFPDCLRVGSLEHNKISSFMRGLGRGILGGDQVKIFSSRSRDYLESLRRINELPGNEWFVSPELRSFLRPDNAEGRWLREARGVSQMNLTVERTHRANRRHAFEMNLAHYPCVDIYPISATKLESWRGMPLSSGERVGFLGTAVEFLEQYPLYQIVLIEGTDKQKYWLKESTVGKFVIFEMWGYVDIRRESEVGGLIFADQAFQSFLVETQRLIERSMFTRDETIDHLRRALSAE